MTVKDLKGILNTLKDNDTIISLKVDGEFMDYETNQEMGRVSFDYNLNKWEILRAKIDG